MEKASFLRARVSDRLKQDFEDICKVLGNKQPTVQLRELVEQFVREKSDQLDDRIIVHIYRPDGYDLGAWRVLITLRNPEEGLWCGKPIPFALPTLEKRRLDSDKEYQSIVGVPSKEHFVGYGMGGSFINGEWRGHLYSNGIAEKDNPTSIEEVRILLVNVINSLLDKFSTGARR